jgi:hypothetical protein
VTYNLGFRITGPCTEARKLIDWPTAFAAYAALDDRAEVNRESYLSAFCFGDDFAAHLKRTGSTAGFNGPTWAPFAWWDIDRDDPAEALDATRRLLGTLVDRYGADDDSALVFFSGRKGLHVGLHTSLWAPTPGPTFHETTKRFAIHAAQLAGITIDVGTYARVQAFRAPNSKHPRTGRHKRRLTIAEAMGLRIERIIELAETPEPFDVPTPTATSSTAAGDWTAAAEAVNTEAVARRSGPQRDRLNRATLDFIRDGAATGDRHRLTYSAAANLAELGAPLGLAFALLESAALDCGLPPIDTRRAIENGWASQTGRIGEVCNAVGGIVLDVRRGEGGAHE